MYCTTSNTYFRKLSNNPDKQFGIYIENGKIIPKKELGRDVIGKILKTQISQLEQLLKTYNDITTDKNMDNILAILNHEYLHQGELILMFREAEVELPKRFIKAWALG